MGTLVSAAPPFRRRRPRLTLRIRHPYHLLRTLSCGQTFRWRLDAAGATGIFRGRAVRLEQVRGAIIVEGLDGGDGAASLERFLGLDQPLGPIERELARDPILRRILPQTSGIAILRQDPWECLVSFIISAFNNIPKIEMTLDRLAARFGRPVPGGGRSFPRAPALAAASERTLRQCVLGYRAPYVRAVAGLVSSGAFDPQAPFALPYDAARRLLLSLPGVGEKVADCVLLFAYGKGDAFPVDVWVKRAVERWYFRGRAQPDRRIREFARSRFGALAGYAQQHLFVAARATLRS